MPLSKKERKHVMIWNKARELGQDVKGYCHRIHRTRNERTGNGRILNKRKVKQKEITEKELWDDVRKQINLIGG